MEKGRTEKEGNRNRRENWKKEKGLIRLNIQYIQKYLSIIYLDIFKNIYKNENCYTSSFSLISSIHLTTNLAPS